MFRVQNDKEEYSLAPSIGVNYDHKGDVTTKILTTTK